MGHKKGLLRAPEYPTVTSKWHPSSQLMIFPQKFSMTFGNGAKQGPYLEKSAIEMEAL